MSSRVVPAVQAYGKTTYLITSLKLVPRGTEGAVSLEGTVAGLAAAAAYAGAAVAIGQVCALTAAATYWVSCSSLAV